MRIDHCYIVNKKINLENLIDYLNENCTNVELNSVNVKSLFDFYYNWSIDFIYNEEANSYLLSYNLLNNSTAIEIMPGNSESLLLYYLEGDQA